jgi:hypothetical protein
MKPRRFAGLEVKIEVKKKPKSAAARWLAKVCNWTVLALFVGFVVWRISLEVRIDARLKRIAARGEPVTASQLNRAYIAVPDHENAALSWLNGFEQRVPKFRPGYPPWSRVTLPGRGKSPSENWFEAAQGFLNSNQAALIAFERAASMEKSRFPVDLANGLLTDTPHLGKLRSSAELLQLEAFVAAEQGDANGAIGSITRILSAARTLRSEPTLMAMLTQSSMDLIAFKSAERLLNCIALTDSQLQQLSKAFADTDNPLRLWQALVGERTMLLSTLAQPKKVLAHDDSANERTKLGNAIAAMLCEITGFFDREVRFLIDAFESNLPLTRLPDPDRFQAREAWNQVEQDSRKGYYLLSGILLPSLPRTIARDCENRARARVIQAVFAIERFRLASEGKLPPNVAALVPQFSPTVPMDPFDGQPLRLRPTPSGYVVYSIGSDAQDDSGAVRTNKKSQGATGDIALLVGR